jgi:hypothetical protein
MMLGLMTGIEKSGKALEQSLDEIMSPAYATGGHSIDNSRRAAVYGGYHVHVEGGDRNAPLRRLWEADL